MSGHTPTMRVMVGFQTTGPFGNAFILDNDPLGKLDTGGGLGGVVMVDLTDQCMSIATNRGRNRNTESFNAGTASVVFKDPNRDLDPLNTASIYYPYVTPRQPIAIYADEIPIYTGLITDWNLEYDFSAAGDRMVAQCADGFTVMANQSMNAWTPSLQSSGQRIEAVLSRPEIEYQGAYELDTGQSQLGAYAIAEGTNVLTYLNTVTASEAGWLFMAADGALTFLDRHTVLNPVATIEFTDQGTGVPYSSLTNQYGDELLYNSIQMQSPAGAVQLAADVNSIGQYQAQQFSKLDLLNSTTGEVLNLAQAFLGAHKDPLLRFTGVTVQLAALSDAQKQAVLSAELVDTVSVEKQFATGSPSTVTQNVIVSGIRHTITPGSHTISFTFENIDQRAFMTLDSALLGTLDANRLAF